ncbi:MAG: hypothetical protein O3C19_02305, partial [Bacteroidetes bacterium]|nr:hypothetical protein [Bacteroidota bacterium]
MAESTSTPKGANAYSIYVDKDTKSTQVNWAEISKGLADGANKIAIAREAEKAAIDEATRKAIDDLNQIADTDTQSLGTLLINGSNYSKEMLMANMELMRNGGLKPKDFKLIMQQQKDGYKNLSKFVEGANEKYKTAMERLENGEDGASIASDLEISWNEGTFGFGDLRNKRVVSNPTTGELVLVTMEEGPNGELVQPDPKVNPEAYQNVAYINQRTKFKLDRRNTNNIADAIVENLATVIDSSVGAYSAIGGGGVVTSVEDFRQLFGDISKVRDSKGNIVNELVNDDGSTMTYDQFMSDQIDVITGGKDDLSSTNALQVLTSAGYRTVQSEAEAKKKGFKKYIIYKNVNGRPEVQLTEDQMMEARNIAKRAIEARIDLKIKQTQPDTGEQKQQPTATSIGNDRLEESRANLYATVNDLVSADPNKASSAGTTLANIYNKSREAGRPEITGEIIRTIDAEGKAKFTFPFADRVMTIDGQFENGDPKTVTDIIREIYDVVNPYKDDVTVAEAAFNKKNGKVGTGIGKGDAAGSVAFKTIEPVDFNSDVTIEGVAQSPLGYLEDQLDETLDEGSNATGPEIEKALTQAINSVLPQVALDN